MAKEGRIAAIEESLRGAERAIKDLVDIVNNNYVKKPGDPVGVGTQKIYDAKYWVGQIRKGVRTLKRDATTDDE